MILPRITAIGAIDEAGLTLPQLASAVALDLLPAVPPARRNAVLARLILGLPTHFGGPRRADGAWRLAVELAALMDEAEHAGVDLDAALPHAVAGEHAVHWQLTLDFLRIVTQAWPRWLAEAGLANPVARQTALIDAEAQAWRTTPPSMPVWAAGFTAAEPALARLLAAIAAMPQGRVIIPEPDTELPADVVLPDSHPEAATRRLLARLEAGPPLPWPGPVIAAAPQGRAATLRRALLPAGALAAWQQPADEELAGLSRLAPADEQEEAVAIALILRDALERPGSGLAALITPDRALARRVSAELLRFGVVADDSAGEALGETPPGVFLRLLAEAVAADLAPLPLLALLKHPLLAAGLDPPRARQAARSLERACLRGPAPPPGLTGLRERLAEAPEAAAAVDLLDRLERGLAPLLRVAAGVSVAPSALLTAAIESAEALAASDAEPGVARLWALEEGEALATHLGDMLEAAASLPDQPPAVLPGLLRAMLEGAVVRSRRALRGRGGAEHPRVVIWGLLEARLQSAGLVVLGGLAEGVWPPASDPGPWLSRPMREAVGLPSPEAAIGQSARDFLAAASAAREVVLSCPRRREGAPAVPARWLVRLEALLRGRGLQLAEHQAASWARALDLPAGPARPASPPHPCPPLTLRPRRLRVTEIETWLRDPYAIYARHVLRLVPLAPIEEAIDDIDYGILVHEGLHRCLEAVGTGWPEDAAARLGEALEVALANARLRPALTAWLRPRLARIAAWVAARERTRRAEDGAPVALAGERGGSWDLPGLTVSGRADRIESHADGRIVVIDYKTGTAPDQKLVRHGLAPQLPLLAAMAQDGAFGPDFAAAPRGLLYWRLTGGFEPGEEFAPLGADGVELAREVAAARQGLLDLIARFARAEQAYLAQPVPGRVPFRSDYAQLARVAEWAGVGEEED